MKKSDIDPETGSITFQAAADEAARVLLMAQETSISVALMGELRKQGVAWTNLAGMLGEYGDDDEDGFPTA